MHGIETRKDRVRKPLTLKLNPIWWFENDDDPEPPDWYHLEWPQWRRDLTWHVIRNPLHNFMFYVVGCQDRNFTVWGNLIGDPPSMQTDASNSGLTGWCYCVLLPGKEIWIPRPYLSYVGKWWSWHIGWNNDGAFACRSISSPELHT